MANCVYPGESACNEQSYLDLHYLQRYLYWSVGMKGLVLKQFSYQWQKYEYDFSVHYSILSVI